MRTFALLVRHGVTDRSDDKKFYEVYPAGSLSQWGLTSRGYKKNTPDHKESRESILGGLREKMAWLVVPDACATTGDGLDALIASLTPAQRRRVAPCAPHPNKLPTHVARDGFTCRPAFRVCDKTVPKPKKLHREQRKNGKHICVTKLSMQAFTMEIGQTGYRPP